MALTSLQSLIHTMNFRNLWLVMSILFVPPRKLNLIQILNHEGNFGDYLMLIGYKLLGNEGLLRG